MVNDQNDHWNLSQKYTRVSILLCLLSGLSENEYQSPVQSDIPIVCDFAQANQAGPSKRKWFDLKYTALPLFQRWWCFLAPAVCFNVKATLES